MKKNEVKIKTPFKNTNIKKLKLAVCHGQGDRPYQEDSYAYNEHMSGRRFAAVVADGMGGIEGGKEVSSFAADKLVSMAEDIDDTEAVFEQLSDIVCDINREIIDRQIPGGSTLASIYCNNQGIYWCCVGDSRVYLYRDNTLTQLNEDGDYLNRLFVRVLSGELPISSALSDPQKDSLASYMGYRRELTIDGNIKPLAPCLGDRILICSDGIYNYISEKELMEMLKEGVAEAAKKLEIYNNTKEFKNHDNYTALIIEFN